MVLRLTECHGMNKPKYKKTRPLADLVGDCLNQAFARQGFASVEIVTHWEDIAGAELARRSEPLKLIWPRRDDPDSEGTLIVRVEGAYALDLQYQAPMLIERVNRYFGWRVVGRVSIRQGPVTPRARPASLPLEPSAESIARVERGLGDFEDERLKSALARLGALVRNSRNAQE
jgi:hypothetical protein